MGYRLYCDNAACADEIEVGEGQPTLMAKGKVYCQRCAGIVGQVEAEIRKTATQKAHLMKAEIDAMREDLLARMLPPQRGGTGEGHTEWPKVG